MNILGILLAWQHIFSATGHTICAIVAVVAPPGGENEIDTIGLDVRNSNIYMVSWGYL